MGHRGHALARLGVPGRDTCETGQTACASLTEQRAGPFSAILIGPATAGYDASACTPLIWPHCAGQERTPVSLHCADGQCNAE